MVLHSIILFLVFLKFVTTMIKDEQDQKEEKHRLYYHPTTAPTTVGLT
jgi:hypothetical protein